MPLLSEQIKLKRRYSRSINLERDLEIVDSVLGYIPTTRGIDVISRFLNSFYYPNTSRAWTITGLYGTGKSAFAHFLTALCGSVYDQMKINALEILKYGSETEKTIYEKFRSKFPDEGLLRAIVTSSYEPVSNTVVKALYKGASLFWKNNDKKPEVFQKLEDLYRRVSKGDKITNEEALTMFKEVADSSKTGILLIIDELGKNFEFAAHNQRTGDIFLLQQITELPADSKSPKVFIFGLLHRSFSDYAHSLTIIQRNEWGKIQGRFEDIPFNEASEQIVRLIGNAIDKSESELDLNDWSKSWKDLLYTDLYLNSITSNDIKSLYPLHPLSALVLPLLCTKYAQNDRTLFTFLTGSEPHSLYNFLGEFRTDNIPTLKLYRIYDYFVESAGITMSSLPQYQRWVEIQNQIQDAKCLEPDMQLILKIIGVLNLITVSGSLKASRKLVSLAMCDSTKDRDKLNYWDELIDKLIGKGLITWRKQLDELRIWEGSDFNVEKAIGEQIETIKISLSDMLSQFKPLRPLVAQRHSYETGTLRYFESQFIDSSINLNEITFRNNGSDGLICYWIDKAELLNDVPENTKDGRPLIVISSSELGPLSSACLEYAAIKTIEKSAPELRTDGVARKEVRYRIDIAKMRLNESFRKTFNMKNGVTCWISGKVEEIRSEAEFKGRLSDLCDNIYSGGITFWNELINRRQLSSQASNARRALITDMINNTDKERFEITGYGPERSIYESLLGKTGIHKINGDVWKIDKPSEESCILPVWEAIEEFCMKAIDAPKTVDLLYKKLKASPYGVKDGPIPVLLAAVLLKYSDELSLYKEGAFIPVLGSEHFDLLMKNPERFAVKHIPIKGLKLKVFRELETILYKPGTKIPQANRNETILGIVKPLVRFAMKLPACTKNTKKYLSKEAISLKDALLSAKEPDNLIFIDIPKALGLPPIDDTLGKDRVKSFKDKLVKTLQELNTAYERLLSDCRKYICEAFSIESSELRNRLPMRARFLQDKCVKGQHLTRLVIVAMDDNQDEKGWIEGLTMVISDKPASSWFDEDFLVFENNLGNLSRKFINLEALQKNYSSSVGFDVRRITVTRPNGTEVNQMVWIEEKYKKDADKIIEELLKKTAGNKQLQHALVALFTEKVLDIEEKGEK